ncbi:(R,R)-butanediol dehydrogenase/meso-butanediol dehydrogenase/diacetyl reductase [Bradyrhizobium sp. LA6.10]
MWPQGVYSNLLEPAAPEWGAKFPIQFRTVEAGNKIRRRGIIRVRRKWEERAVKAVRYYGRKDIRVETVAEPKEMGTNQLLVKPLWTGICGTDLHEYIAGPIVTPAAPHVFTAATLPQILGHEFSAEVLDVGREVTHVRRGDRISVQPLVMPMNDYYSRRGLNHLSEKMGCVGLSWAWGGMSDLAIINDYNAAKVPDTISNEEAAMIEPAAVALYAVDRGGVQAGSTVLIAGAGPIGALTILCAHAAGAARIYVSEPNASRRRTIESWGICAGVYDPKAIDVIARVKEHTEENVGVDVAIECVGNESALNTCVEAVRRRGVVVQAGLHVGKASTDPMLWALKDITIEATWCYPITMWPRIIGLVESGKLPISKIIDGRIRAEDVVAKGFDVLTAPSNDKLKILVSTQLAAPS